GLLAFSNRGRERESHLALKYSPPAIGELSRLVFLGILKSCGSKVASILWGILAHGVEEGHQLVINETVVFCERPLLLCSQSSLDRFNQSNELPVGAQSLVQLALRRQQLGSLVLESPP